MELGFRASRKSKIIFAAFIMTMVVCVFAPVIAHADTNYNDLPAEVLDRITVRSGLDNAVRSVGFGILKFLAEGVDGIEKGINTILNFKVTDIFDGLGLTDGSGYGISKTLVSVVFTIFLLIGSLTLIIFRSKIRLNDFFVGVLTSAGMIIALPAAISAFDQMRSGGLSDLSSIDNAVGSQDSNGVYHSTGVDVLSSCVYNVKSSADNKKLLSVAATKADRENIFSIDINDVVTYDLRYKVSKGTPIESGTEQKQNSTLSTADKFHLLGLAADYSRYASTVANGGTEVRYYHSASSTAEEMAQRAGVTTMDISVPIDLYKEQLMNNVCVQIKNKIPDFDLNSAFKKVQPMLQSSIDACISLFDSELQQINTRRNHAIYIQEVRKNNSTYTFSPLLTHEQYEGMDAFDKLSKNIERTFYPEEYVYRYDFDFLPSLVILIALSLALIFAGLKIASVIYDLLFIQLIAGIVIASDQRNSGRAKKMFQELLNCYLIFLLCALMIKLFLKASLYVVNMTDPMATTFVKLILIIGFAKATVDAPDIIVKIIGTDAGVKSGAAAAMTVMGAVRAAKGLARPVTSPAANLGKRAISGAAHKVGSGAADAAREVGSRTAGAVGGAIGGMASGAKNAYSTAREGGKGFARSAVDAVGGAVGGTVGGAASGAFGDRSEGNAVKRGAATGSAFGAYAASASAGTAVKSAGSKIGSGVYNALRPYSAVKSDAAEQPAPSQMQQDTGSAFNERAEVPASAPDTGTANRAEAPAPENSRADAPEGGNS